MPHHIGHCSSLREATCALHLVKVLKKFIGFEFLTCYILKSPNFVFVVRVKSLVVFHKLSLVLRKLIDSVYPDNVYLFRDQGRSVALGPLFEWFVLIGWVEDCQLLHRKAILYKMVHIVTHGKGFILEGSPIEILAINLFPLIGRHNEGRVKSNVVRHIKDMSIFLDEPLHSLNMRFLNINRSLSEISYNEKKLLKEDKSFVVVSIFIVSQHVLWNSLVAVRVEHSQVILYLGQSFNIHSFASKIQFVVLAKSSIGFLYASCHIDT
jgi:hypothetical protein